MKLKNKIIIIDDEQQIIDYIVNLTKWEDSKYEIVNKFNTSMDALIYIKNYPVDIVITDIHMPVIDGLELSEKIMEISKEIKIIILTAYPLFEYAHKAMSIGITNYILKHELSERVLLDRMDRLSEEIIDGKEKSRLKKEKEINSILTGISSDYHREKIKKILFSNKNSKNKIMLVSVDKTIDNIINNYDTNINLNNLISKINLDVSKDNSGVFIQIATDKSICIYEDNINTEEVIEEIQSRLDDIYGLSVSIVYSSISDTDNILKTINKLKEASNIFPFIGKNVSVELEKVNLTKEIAIDLDEDINALGFYEGYKLILNYIEESMRIRSIESLVKVIKIGSEFIKNSTTYSLPPIDTRYDMYIKDIYTVEEYKELFIKSANMINGERKDISTKTAKAIEYIQRNYRYDISIEEIAENIDTSPKYLQKLFKKETKITIVKYITNYKINIAINMLISGKYKVLEVSEYLGFGSSQYFSKVFKKVTGKMPTEYINLC